MPPRAEAGALLLAPPPSTKARPGLLVLLPACLLFLLLPARPSAADSGTGESYLDAEVAGPRRRERLVMGGARIPVVGGGSLQPQLAGYVDLPLNLQLGLEATVGTGSGETGYDYLPRTGLHLRQLWLSDQDTSSIRDSEHISVVAGAYPAYDFKGDRVGPRPYGAIHLGKYWMPFDDKPYGLDFSLELTRYFLGHPPGLSRVHHLGAGVNLFVALP